MTQAHQRSVAGCDAERVKQTCEAGFRRRCRGVQAPAPPMPMSAPSSRPRAWPAARSTSISPPKSMFCWSWSAPRKSGPPRNRPIPRPPARSAVRFNRRCVSSSRQRGGSARSFQGSSGCTSPRPASRRRKDRPPADRSGRPGIEAARDRGEAIEVDPFHSAVFFLLGLYALLTTTRDSKQVRAGMLEKFVATALRSLEAL